MVVRFKQAKNTMLRCALRFARMYRIEPRLKEAQMTQTGRDTMLRYTLRVARIYSIEPRLKEAQMILSLGSNRLKLEGNPCQGLLPAVTL